jgi:hypothetical protein
MFVYCSRLGPLSEDRAWASWEGFDVTGDTNIKVASLMANLGAKQPMVAR